jgi:hypothetical protein
MVFLKVERIDIDRYVPRCECIIRTSDENGNEIERYSCKNRAIYDVYVYPDGYPETDKRYSVMKCCEEHIDRAKNWGSFLDNIYTRSAIK